MDRMMSREEVAGILGVSPSYLGELVKSGDFPAPIPIGKSSRTDRWPENVVQRWMAKKEGIIYGNKSGKASGATSTNDAGKSPAYFTGQDIAVYFGTNASRVFAALVSKGLLQEGDDDYSHYRPTDEGFKRGLFWRIEKYTMRDEKFYYQTVITAYGKDEVLEIVREALNIGRKR